MGVAAVSSMRYRSVLMVMVLAVTLGGAARAGDADHGTYRAAVKAIGRQPLPAAVKREILDKLSKVHDGMRRSPAREDRDHYDMVSSPNEVIYEGTHGDDWLEFSVSHRHQDGHVIHGKDTVHWSYKTVANGDQLLRVTRNRDDKTTSFLRLRDGAVVAEGAAVERELQRELDRLWSEELSGKP
jgi:hypothetical protein